MNTVFGAQRARRIFRGFGLRWGPVVSLLVMCALSGCASGPMALPSAAAERAQLQGPAAQAQVLSWPVLRVDGLPIVRVRIGEDEEVYPFLLDSGAHYSVVDERLLPKRAEPLNIGEGEVLVESSDGVLLPTARMARLPSLSVGALELRGLPVLVDRLDGLSRALRRPVAGILAVASLSGFTLELPAGQPVAILRRAALPEPDGRSVFATEAGLPRFAMTIAGRDHPVLIDTGSNGSLQLPRDWASRLSLSTPPVPTAIAVGMSGRERVALTSRLLSRLRIGSVEIPDPMVEFKPGSALLGGAVLQHLSLVFDPENSRVAVRAGPRGVPRPAALRGYGFRLVREGDGVSVGFVAPTGPAGKAGLLAGDQVVAAGREATGAALSSWDTIRGALREAAERGEPVMLSILREGQPQRLSFQEGLLVP